MHLCMAQTRQAGAGSIRRMTLPHDGGLPENEGGACAKGRFARPFLFRGPRRAAQLVIFLTVLGATACRRAARPEPGIIVKSQIAPRPARVGPATVTIQMKDIAAKPVSRATIQVEADMSHPGMSPVFGEAEEIGPGSYQARTDFSMPGDWVVLFHIQLPDGQKIERQMDVRGVRLN